MLAFLSFHKNPTSEKAIYLKRGIEQYVVRGDTEGNSCRGIYLFKV
jgi:hypothetical protein